MNNKSKSFIVVLLASSLTTAMAFNWAWEKTSSQQTSQAIQANNANQALQSSQHTGKQITAQFTNAFSLKNYADESRCGVHDNACKNRAKLLEKMLAAPSPTKDAIPATPKLGQPHSPLQKPGFYTPSETEPSTSPPTDNPLANEPQPSNQLYKIY